MKIGDNDWNLDPLGKHIWRGRMEAGQLLALARAVKEEGGQLIALWGSDNRHLNRGYAIHAALLTSAGLAWVTCALPEDAPAYPDLAHIFPQADRMQLHEHQIPDHGFGQIGMLTHLERDIIECRQVGK